MSAIVYKIDYEEIFSPEAVATEEAGDEETFTPGDTYLRITLRQYAGTETTTADGKTRVEIDSEDKGTEVDSFISSWRKCFGWSPEQGARAMSYGHKKLLQDRVSSVTDVVEKFGAMRTYDKVFSEDHRWTAPRTASTRTVPVEVQALAEVHGQPVSVIQKILANFTAEQKAQAFSKPRVQEVVKRIQESEVTEEQANEIASSILA